MSERGKALSSIGRVRLHAAIVVARRTYTVQKCGQQDVSFGRRVPALRSRRIVSYVFDGEVLQRVLVSDESEDFVQWLQGANVVRCWITFDQACFREAEQATDVLRMA